jgi:hypothetical protein
MTEMERAVATMHQTVNTLSDVQAQLKAVGGSLAKEARFTEVRRATDSLLARLKAWDADMVSRRSRAYDDVENFEQKFTANWMFMINATDSDIPRVNQPSRDRRVELEAQWAKLKARSDEMLTVDIPALSKRFWDLGLGALWKVPLTTKIVP